MTSSGNREHIEQSESGQFGVLAAYYDKLNYNADYRKVADYIESVFKLYGKNPELVLDLACGTGSLTVEMAKRGYDMIGIDLSPEMLNTAGFKKSRGKNILWINQDMRSFELYGTVDAVLCCFDSLNYILDESGIEKCVKLVYHYLNPGGLFIFDVNSKYKFEKIYGKNDIILERNGVLCSWRNNYNRRSGICEFLISLFAEQPDKSYKRLDEIQSERYYSESFFTGLLERTGFTDLKKFYDFGIINKEKQESERICFSALKNNI
jgi:SAM-dependent methyltransferase